MTKVRWQRTHAKSPKPKKIPTTRGGKKGEKHILYVSGGKKNRCIRFMVRSKSTQALHGAHLPTRLSRAHRTTRLSRNHLTTRLSRTHQTTRMSRAHLPTRMSRAHLTTRLSRLAIRERATKSVTQGARETLRAHKRAGRRA